MSEAKASYGLYSKDVDWEAIGTNAADSKRAMRSIRGIFWAMLMKLSPPRRVLLLAAIVLLLLDIHLRWGAQSEFSFDISWLGVGILFVLLAVELADRATTKRDLEIGRKIQQWLIPEHAPTVPGVDIAFATRPQDTVAGD